MGEKLPPSDRSGQVEFDPQRDVDDVLTIDGQAGRTLRGIDDPVLKTVPRLTSNSSSNSKSTSNQ